MIRTLTLLLACAAALPASAQTVWRCGTDANLYADTPCAGGRALELAETPGAAAVAEAHRVAERERQALRNLAAERHARENELRQQGWGLAIIRTVATSPARKHSKSPRARTAPRD